jgi:twitching motility two-component system response regulator PilH
MSDASTGSGKILVVDDDRDTALYLSVLLEDKGYEVRTAEDGAEALSQLDEFPADTVIMDVLMPGRSGLDLLVKLRNSPRWRDLMVIVVTGNDRVLEDYGKSYLSLHKGIRGPDAVLGKPVDPVALLRLLDTRMLTR